MLYLIGGPSRVGKSTVASRLSEASGASLLTTDAIVWMLQVAAPQLGVRHGSATKPDDARPYLIPFVEAATVDGTRDLILEGDALGPPVVAEFLQRWDGRAVFLGGATFDEADVRAGGGYVSTLSEDGIMALASFIRRRSFVEQIECETLGLPYIDVGEDRGKALADALTVLTT